MQAIEDWECHDTTVSLGHSRQRLFLPEALVWPRLVVEAGVLRDEAQKMAPPSTRKWSSNSRRRVPTKRSAKAFMFGVRTAVRTTLVPTDSNRLANRAPSLASRSTPSTSGWMSKVAFRACCAHQSSDGARVTAACMILRLFRSRKNRG